MKQAIIDTDTLSFFFRNKPEVVGKINEYLEFHGVINLSIVTYYEVLNGLLFKDAQKQFERFERFVELNQIIALNVEVAKKAAEIYADLRKKGQVIGHNDVLIAATAIVYDLVLVTNNTNHFSRIPALILDNWVQQ
ncbi:type II toxin-antitoxin system VapC family toxin [Haliscomenobacter hydrossis]|uniref:PilT protein domain protein n=1 Tax=Haliscomenobacter hydrossis (strain ATCC 27775 / DSM 1100 / LMG 10767 / O) TaxID=760192 RepID=F4KVC3_HALH1|nr:type II toxin-antitoxin system VapC family toxin [Haliscomenobacter hydrossis]AEE50249.1 PilT protein domain protein [Haliscomenobacter hydrossis DSM 1100]